MSVVDAVRKSLSVQVALKLAVVVVVLTAAAGAVISLQQMKRMEQLTLEKAEAAARFGAGAYGEALDAAIDGGLLTVNDAFDRTYEPIKGYEFHDRPKFHSKFDLVTDAAVIGFQDAILETSPDFLFAIGQDDHGYIPTHDRKFQQPVSGDKAKDLLGNRTKRITPDPIPMAAVTSKAPVLVQEYVRDTGERAWDVSAPIRVKGKHWGAFRVGVSRERVEAGVWALTLTLIGMFAVFIGVTLAALYVVVQRAMRPVVALTAAAEAISMGEGLETSLKSPAVDEIGQLTKAVDRLRISMKAAMSRLGA